MPPKAAGKAQSVSTNFVRNNYRGKIRHGKTRHTPDSARSLGKRYRNGKLKVSTFRTRSEYIAEVKAKQNAQLYHDLLSPEELAKALAQEENHSCSTNHLDEKVGTDDECTDAENEYTSVYQRMAQGDVGTTTSYPPKAEPRDHARSSSNAIFTDHQSTSRNPSITASTPSPGACPAGVDYGYLAKLSTSKAGLASILKSYFGFQSFNPGQEDAVRLVLESKSALLVLPTGAGKSLCYQLPAAILPGVALIVTPLLSLMQDQLAHLPQSLPGAQWSSAMTPKQTSELVARLQKGEIKVSFSRLCQLGPFIPGSFLPILASLTHTFLHL